jgi:hypothetical protein
MRNVLLVSWLLLPIGAWAYHEGPGQDRLALDDADAVIVAAHAAAAKGEWKQAIAKYEDAIGKLPTKNEDAVSKTTERRLHLELNKARMQASKLPDAREALDTLVEEMETDPDADRRLLAETRQALARSQFYTTWLMRLEGRDRKEWEPEIDAARQNWRLLAEEARDEKEAATHRSDLESAIRLSRLEIEDLQGLPLPSE